MAYEKRDIHPKGVKKTPSEERIQEAEEELRYYNELSRVPDEVEEGMALLKEQREPDLTNIKDSCKFELQRFISMRGTFDKLTGEVFLPLLTVSDMSTASTIKSIRRANDLITSIDAANSLEEVSLALQGTSTSELIASSIVDDLEEVIDKCMFITEFAKGYHSNSLAP